VFGKYKLKAISEVEYYYKSCIIRTSNKVKVEQAIMNENKNTLNWLPFHYYLVETF